MNIFISMKVVSNGQQMLNRGPLPQGAPLKTLELENMGDAFNTSAGKYTAHFKRRGKETEMRNKIRVDTKTKT